MQGIWKGLSSPLLYFARDDPSCSLKFNISGFIPTVVQLRADEVNPFSQITVSLHPEKSLLPSKAWTTTAPQGSRSSQQSPISARREGGPRGSDLQVSPPTGRMSCLHSPSPLSPSPGSKAELRGSCDGPSSESVFLEGCLLTAVTSKRQAWSLLDSPHTKCRSCRGEEWVRTPTHSQRAPHTTPRSQACNHVCR